MQDVSCLLHDIDINFVSFVDEDDALKVNPAPAKKPVSKPSRAEQCRPCPPAPHCSTASPRGYTFFSLYLCYTE
jgi:hypothetical protein